MDKKIVSVVFIGLLISVVISGYLYVTLIQTQNDLGNQIVELQNERDEANQQVENLQGQLYGLQNQVDSLNSQITNLNTELDEQNTIISEMLLQLDSKYHLTNDNGIYILNYTYSDGLSGLSQTYTADITLYNALSTATVTIKLYGSDSKLFTYEIPTGSTLHRVETWTGDMWARDYSQITVDSVER